MPSLSCCKLQHLEGSLITLSLVLTPHGAVMIKQSDEGEEEELGQDHVC